MISFLGKLRGHLFLGLCLGLITTLAYTAIQQTPTFQSTLLWFISVTLGFALASWLCVR